MTLAAAKLQIAAHAARLAAEIARGGHADQMLRGGVASWMRERLVAEYAPTPATSSLRALAGRLCGQDLTDEEVRAEESELRRMIAVALVDQAIDFGTLLAAHPERIAPARRHALRSRAAWDPARLERCLAAARA